LNRYQGEEKLLTETNNHKSAEEVLKLIRTKDAAFWFEVREQRALALFHEAAQRVPAYRDVIRRNHIDPIKIKTFADFEQHVPPISKKSYLQQYPLEMLCWDGTLKKPLVFTATSGSTGVPFYFPRSERLDWDLSLIHEMFIHNGNNGAYTSGPTLVIVGFGMGVWIGGLITYKAYEMAAARGGYPVSILTPGINKKEIYNALRRLAPNFSQTILIGYPPFVKDILDGAGEQGIDLSKLHLRLSFAAEAFTENFRDYLAGVGHLKNICLDSMSIYGSADIGGMAFETPLAILVRRLAVADCSRGLFNSLFTNISKTPTLAQYNPYAITFEAPDGDILLTGDNAIPLVRYAIGDHGGAMSYGEVMRKVEDSGISLTDSAKRHGLDRSFFSELPFVYVYERADFSTTLYGLQIYPEHIREAILRPPVHTFLTGKFTLSTKFDERQNQFLEINLEARRNIEITKETESVILETIMNNLMAVNSEYRELRSFLGDKAKPRLIFWPAEDVKYFRPGVKQKWVMQNQ
jgi:phenylacetate-coenzyme A ligase PaaK-like adenylate-forming protein